MTSKAALRPHVLSLRLYGSVFLALVALTGVTVLTAQWNLGAWNIWLAMLIASAKAALVLAVFMHLWFDSKFLLLVLGGTLTFLAVFAGLTLMDLSWRATVDAQQATGLPRDERVYEYQRQHPGTPPLRPGLREPRTGETAH
ncbi:MAG: cytochrome C oxidase subunit IV family protein [Myxococcota bacterium]